MCCGNIIRPLAYDLKLDEGTAAECPENRRASSTSWFLMNCLMRFSVQDNNHNPAFDLVRSEV